MNPKCSVRKTAMQESLGDIESIVRDDTISPDIKIKFLEMIQDNKKLRTEAEKAIAKAEAEKAIAKAEAGKAIAESRAEAEKAIGEAEKAIVKAEAAKAIGEAERANSELRADATNKELVELKYKYFALKSQYAAVITIRPLIESWAGQYLPSLTSTDAVINITESLLCKQKPNIKAKLNIKAKAWLTELEGSCKYEKDVVKELKDLFHELSKIHHHLQPQVAGVGFVCGGSMPLRAAVALVILQLQTELDPTSTFPVRYTNQEYDDKFLLINGKVKPKVEDYKIFP